MHSEPTAASIRKCVAKRAFSIERCVFRMFCWVLWVDIDRDEAIEQRCAVHPTQRDIPDVTIAANSEIVFEHAIRTFEAAEKRQDAVKEKGRNLLPVLTVVASLVTLSVGFFGHGYGLFVPVVFALGTILLHQEVLALGWSGFPRMDESFLGAKEEEQRARLTMDYLRAARFVDSRTDYMTEVLKAARRSAGLTLFAIVVVTSLYVVRGKQQETAELIRALRGDSALINELRGPRGDVGAPGPAGPSGRQGPKGDTGAPGPSGLRRPQDEPAHH